MSAGAGGLQVSTKMGEPGADVDKLMARMDALQTAIDAANGWELERQLQRATDALRCPPGAKPWTPSPEHGLCGRLGRGLHRGCTAMHDIYI